MNAIELLDLLLNKSDFNKKIIIIKQNYNECSGTVELPANVTLDFLGGSLNLANGATATIVGNNTILKGDVKINNITLTGTWIHAEQIKIEDDNEDPAEEIEEKWRKITILDSNGNPTILHVYGKAFIETTELIE